MKRRLFITGAIASTFATALSACMGNRSKKQGGQDSESPSKVRLQALSKDMTKEEIKTILHLRSSQYMAETGNCAQSTFMALRDVFDFGGTLDLRALTALPGIAERGETCGAVTAAVMAIGMVYGDKRPGNRNAYEKSVEQSNLFFDRFNGEAGHTKCRPLLKEGLGMELNLRDPSDVHTYRSLDGPAFCTGIVSKATEIAADMILEK